MDRLGVSDPRRIGPYTLLGRLGTGGMGAVYLGRSSGGRTVAVKVVRSELAGDAGFRDRFRAEVSSARAVSGAFTAPVVDAGPEAALPWMATAFVAGVPLSRAIATRGPLPETSLRMLAAGIAEALADIHRAKLIHRDLKPSNVLLAPDGPHVIDFGISRAMDGAAPLTSTGSVVGSPGYMSPEQLMAYRVGPESDMFSLGATLVYAATGSGAFGEGAPQALLFRVASGEPDRETLAAVPSSLRDVITACLDRDPARRPTPRQLVDYIDQHTPIAAAGSWLPAALTADVVAAGSVVTADSSGHDAGFGYTQGAESESASTGGATFPLLATVGGAPPTVTSPGIGDGIGNGIGTAASGTGPRRRTVLLAVGAAVVLAGGGAGVAALASGGNGGGSGGNPKSGENRLPPASGSTGTMAGPDAKPAWTSTVDSSTSYLTTSGNTLLVATPSDISGLDPATGKSKWAGRSRVSRSAIVSVGETFYALGELTTDSGVTNGLFAIDAESGTVAWSVPNTNPQFFSGDVGGVLNDVVFGYWVGAGGDDTNTPSLWAIDSKTHRQLWQVQGVTGKFNASVCVPSSGNKIFFASGLTSDNPAGAQIQAYDVATGAKGWTLARDFATNFQAANGPIIAGSGNLIYTADRMYAVDPATGKQNWTWTPADSDTELGWPAISAEGDLVAVAGNRNVYVVDAKTGKQKWKTTLADQTHVLNPIANGTPQIADGNVYVLDDTHTIWALDPATGATRWKYSCSDEPVWTAAGGYVYAAYGTKLVAIRAAG